MKIQDIKVGSDYAVRTNSYRGAFPMNLRRFRVEKIAPRDAVGSPYSFERVSYPSTIYDRSPRAAERVKVADLVDGVGDLSRRSTSYGRILLTCLSEDGSPMMTEPQRFVRLDPDESHPGRSEVVWEPDPDAPPMPVLALEKDGRLFFMEWSAYAAERDRVGGSIEASRVTAHAEKAVLDARVAECVAILVAAGVDPDLISADSAWIRTNGSGHFFASSPRRISVPLDAFPGASA